MTSRSLRSPLQLTWSPVWIGFEDGGADVVGGVDDEYFFHGVPFWVRLGVIVQWGGWVYKA